MSYSGLIALLSGCLFVEMKHCNDLLVQKHHCILFVSSIWRIECILFKNYIFCYYLTTLQLCCDGVYEANATVCMVNAETQPTDIALRIEVGLVFQPGVKDLM